MVIQSYSRYVEPVLLHPNRMGIILPAFTEIIPAWHGASELLAEYPLGNSYHFSIKLPVNTFGSNFIAAIRWTEEDNSIYCRYKFFSNSKGILHYPVYNGEKIGNNAVFEIWTINSPLTPTLENDYTFETSALVFPSDGCCGCSNNDNTITLVRTAPTVLPPGSECNPFCTNLCNTPDPMPACDCPINVFPSVADARLFNPAVFVSPAILVTQGGATLGDGYGKVFNWNPISVEVDTGDIYTTVIKPSSIGSLVPGRWTQTSLG